jgi:hypothetical protein
VKILFLLLQQIPSFISNALFLTKVCLRVYNRQSQQRPFYRSRKGDSYGTEVVPYVQYSWQHTLINAEHLKGSAFNAEVLLGVVNHGLMISFITLTCTNGQQLNKQYDHNDFQVDVPGTIGVSKIYLSMYVWFVTLVTFYLVEIFTWVIKLIISPWFTTPNKTSALDAEPFKCLAFISVCCQLYCSPRSIVNLSQGHVSD